jgi:adenosylmethionine-8-amino-7-oxononanoate aminotransferase
MLTTDVPQADADELAPLLPLESPRIYPVSGGSEAVETALKMARANHLARGEDRYLVIGRDGAYHGNTRGALDVFGRAGLRAPYLPCLGSALHSTALHKTALHKTALHTTATCEYRCPFPETHPEGCGERHAKVLDELIVEHGAGRVAAFIAEPVSGAGLGACVPPVD